MFFFSADFYPNKGKNQPGCPIRNKITNIIGKLSSIFIEFIIQFTEITIYFHSEKCSHVRSHHLFLESLKTPFEAIQCYSYEEIQAGKCTFNNVKAIMGGDISVSTPKAYGVFYLETKLQSPYVIPDYKNFNNIEFVTYQS